MLPIKMAISRVAGQLLSSIRLMYECSAMVRPNAALMRQSSSSLQSLLNDPNGFRFKISLIVVISSSFSTGRQSTFFALTYEKTRPYS